MEEEIQKAKRKYIRMFYEAQVTTQELQRGTDHLENQGHIYLYPDDISDAQKTKYNTLTYIKYDQDSENDNSNTFKKLLAENSPDIQNYFSINDNGELVLASLETTTVKTVENRSDRALDDTNTTTTYKATEVVIDYKNMISQYSTSMIFFLELGMVTRNPNFLADVVDMVKENTNIQLTVLDTTTTEITTQVDTSTEHIRGREITTDDADNVITRSYSRDITTTTTTTTTITTVVPNVKVTSVDTWICNQKITYTKIPGTPSEDDYEIEQESDPPKSLPSGVGEVSWTTRENSTVHTSIQVDKYDSGVASEYKYKAGEKPDEDPSYESFVDLLDKEYKIPNSTQKRTAGSYLESDAELFFDLLQQNPETQGMEQVMRYIMYKYTGRDYGVTSLDFSIFDPDYFSDFTGGIYGNSVEEKVWFGLKRMGLSEYAIAGVMGNIYGESGFNPNAIEGGNGEGIGLCQWSFGRRDALEAYAESKGTAWSDVDTQIQFLMGELTIGRRS